MWWGNTPRIINTFVEAYDFSGKMIVPFCTSDGSDIGNGATNLHSATSDAAWLDGRKFWAHILLLSLTAFEINK
ncbi:MAG: hypothetical protein HDR01_09975 [Lachnospiraceae bacterium]|nr:hypothetical protein [Lachnospiraceae bacterium]